MTRYEVRAHNTATQSDNKIHDDEVASRLGFTGGLVPGVDVYAYLCHGPAARWGLAWLESGSMRARFHSPVYDGDVVSVETSDERDGSSARADRSARRVLRDRDGERHGERCLRRATGGAAPADVAAAS